jgi:hypothetical protein
MALRIHSLILITLNLPVYYILEVEFYNVWVSLSWVRLG